MRSIIITLLGIIVISAAVYIYIVTMYRPYPTIALPANAHLRVTGWIVNWDQANGVQSYEVHNEKFTYVSVFWYELTASGKVALYQAAQEEPSLITYVHNHHEKIFTVIANLPDYTEKKDWDPDRVQKVITTESARQKHVADIVELVTSKNFDGVDIDYEALRSSQKNDFSTFIQELGSALHAKGKLLGVAVYPPSPDTSQADYGVQAQDLPALAKSADLLYFMTYLEHTLSSPPGPPGGIQWIASSLEYAITTLHIPKEKIFMGIGLMGIAWRQDPDGSIVGDRDDIQYQEILSIVQNNGITPSWNANSASPYVEFTDQNGKHFVWFENAESVAQKVALADKFDVGGIALWRLGGEDPGVWQYIQ